MQKTTPKAGFTLIELSIVLVIIGLIVGGILTGQELIRQGKLRSVVTQMNKYRLAVNTFKLKYNYYPGDLPNATTYFPTAFGSGNGDWQLPLHSGEEYHAWAHMGLANMIEGGAYPYCSCNEPVPGTNVPASTLGNRTEWMIYSGNNNSLDAVAYPNLKLLLTSFNPLDVGGRPTGGALNGPDAQFIDTKVDDGKPGAGKVIAGSASGVPNCYNGAATAYTTTNLQDCLLSFFLE